MPLGLLTVDIAYVPLRQDFLTKNVLMTAQRDFHVGNSLYALGILGTSHRLFNRVPEFLSPLACFSRKKDGFTKALLYDLS